MKRKLIAVIMTLLMLLATVGCSTEGLSLFGEMKKVSAWEAIESKGSVLISADASGKKVNVSASIKGYVNTQDKQAYMEANITTFSVINVKTDAKFAPIKMYLDKNTVYISKNYFTDIFAASGQPVPTALKAIKEEYIALDTAESKDAPQLDQASTMKLFEKLFINSEIKLPVAQKDREYTIALDSNQMADVSVQFIKQVINNIDEINKISKTGITQKDVDAQKATYETMLAQGKAMIAPVIDGSKATAKYTFEDNKYKQDINAAFKIGIGAVPMTANMTITSEYTKAEKKAITLPTSKKDYTMEQFMTMLMPAYAQLDASQVITKNKQAYVPLKSIMAQLDYAVKYNAKTKKTSVTIDGKDVVVSTITQKGTTYISLSELTKIGFNVTKNVQGVMISK